MANPTLTRGSGNFLSSGTTVLTLYNVQTEAIDKSSGLMRVPLPVLPNADSNNAIMADLLGNSRDIQIEGRFTTQDVADAYKFVRDIVSIGGINAQTLIYGQGNTGGGKVGYTYTPVVNNFSSTGQLTGTLQETMTVYVSKAHVTFTAGEPNTVNYTIVLYEGSSTYSF